MKPIRHNLWRADNTEGRKLVVETYRARTARELEFDHDQWSLILGSLLGDAYLVRTTRGFAFRVNHGIKQSDYVDWKYEKLKDFANSPPRFAKGCYYFRTVSHEEENQFLAEVLRAKLGIQATINKDKKLFRLRVANASMPKLTELIRPFLIPSMLYKLSL